MTTGNSGAVFFLGTRAHYQVLQAPETAYDIENGNTSETIYENPPLQEIWGTEPLKTKKEEKSGNYLTGECGNWINCRRTERHNSEITLLDCNSAKKDVNFESGSGVTRRFRKKQQGSNEEINDNENVIDIDPTALNKSNRDNMKFNNRYSSLKSLLANLKSRRKHKLSSEELDCLETVENVLSMCTYKDSCRCLDCQSRYFECDESDSDYSVSDSYEYDISEESSSIALEIPNQPIPTDPDTSSYDENEEVFVDTVPSDNISTEVLIDKEPVKMSVSSEESLEAVSFGNDKMELEMAAGTPVVLDYLLNHPLTCCIQ